MSRIRVDLTSIQRAAFILSQEYLNIEQIRWDLQRTKNALDYDAWSYAGCRQPVQDLLNTAESDLQKLAQELSSIRNVLEGVCLQFSQADETMGTLPELPHVVFMIEALLLLGYRIEYSAFGPLGNTVAEIDEWVWSLLPTTYGDHIYVGASWMGGTRGGGAETSLTLVSNWRSGEVGLVWGYGAAGHYGAGAGASASVGGGKFLAWGASSIESLGGGSSQVGFTAKPIIAEGEIVFSRGDRDPFSHMPVWSVTPRAGVDLIPLEGSIYSSVSPPFMNNAKVLFSYRPLDFLDWALTPPTYSLPPVPPPVPVRPTPMLPVSPTLTPTPTPPSPFTPTRSFTPTPTSIFISTPSAPAALAPTLAPMPFALPPRPTLVPPLPVTLLPTPTPSPTAAVGGNFLPLVLSSPVGVNTPMTTPVP